MPTATWWRTRRTCRCISARWARACAPCCATARDTLKPGDVVALNNPFNGGTHLPDVTVITPVFDEAGRGHPVLCRQSRGHHADIGGITPGSTPPGSRTLEEEGVVIDDFLLVDGGHFREAEFRALLSRREISGAQPGRERRRHQGAGRRQREGRAGTAPRRRAVRLADGQRVYAPRHGQRRGVGAPGDRPPRQRPLRLHDGQRPCRCASRSASIATPAAPWWISPAPARSTRAISTRRRR